MIEYVAVFTLFSEKKIVIKSKEPSMFESIKSILSSDARFIELKNELCSIASIQSVRFEKYPIEEIEYEQRR